MMGYRLVLSCRRQPVEIPHLFSRCSSQKVSTRPPWEMVMLAVFRAVWEEVESEAGRESMAAMLSAHVAAFYALTSPVAPLESPGQGYASMDGQQSTDWLEVSSQPQTNRSCASRASQAPFVFGVFGVFGAGVLPSPPAFRDRQ